MGSVTTMLFLAALAATPVAAEPVRLVFVGDVMLADGPGLAIAQGADPLAGLAPILHGADLALGNLECSVSRRGKALDKPYTFRADPRSVDILARHIGAVTLANNHSGDFGTDALVDTLDALAAGKVRAFGAGRTLRDAHAPLLVELKGIRIAFLGYNEFFPRRFEAQPARPGVAWSEDEQVVRDIRDARGVHHADLVIPFMHWGWENETDAGARQRYLGHLMVDAGADAVIGSHPHVTQAPEVYKGRPIIHSLGNSVFDGFSSEGNLTGWAVRLDVDRKGVRRWDTVTTRLDERGFPQPDMATAGPCGGRDKEGVGSCQPGATLP